MFRLFLSALAVGIGIIPFGMIAQHMTFYESLRLGMTLAVLIMMVPFIATR
jgi:hypothetical protein